MRELVVHKMESCAKLRRPPGPGPGISRCTTAEDVLVFKMKGSGTNMASVTELLANDIFLSNMMATYNRKTLLHLAARANNVSVLSTVVQAYRKAGLLATALSRTDGDSAESGSTPLDIAISVYNYENTVLLLKEYWEHCPEALTATCSGSTLLHIAASNAEGVLIVKYLLHEYKDICTPMLLTKNKRGLTPLQVAGETKFHAEYSLAFAKKCSEDFHKRCGFTPLTFMMNDPQTERPNRIFELAKELISVLNEPTMQAKAAEAERQIKLREEEKFREKELKTKGELENLLQSEKWDTIFTEYMLSSDEDIQKVALNFLASVVSGSEDHVVLPSLTAELLSPIKRYLAGNEDDPVLKSTLTVLAEFTTSQDSCRVLLSDSEGVLPLVLKLLRSVQSDIQYLCVTALLHLTENRGDNCLPEEWKQPLLLVKHFSGHLKVKRLASEVLDILGASTEVPDPGSWDTADVCLWMEGHSGVERRSEIARAFRDTEISGLHLLELLPTEMAGLGVKFVSDQRKLSGLIDDLRRLNMRSFVGRKDVFLSYAHINVQFALQIKKVLNENDYTVWIDTAGIRAGQKWRTEIAHGIHDCRLFVFIMTPRSTNSQYCHDELSLAEEYKKPIVTVKYQHAEEMDPGLKLTIQRRQWMDFTDSTKFSESCTKLLDAIQTLIGAGSGPEKEEEMASEQVHTVKSTAEAAPGDHVEPTGEAVPLVEVQHIVAREVEKVRQELMNTVHSLETQVSNLSTQVSNLSTQVSNLSTRLAAFENTR